jgi:hypothetical protein
MFYLCHSQSFKYVHNDHQICDDLRVLRAGQRRGRKCVFWTRLAATHSVQVEESVKAGDASARLIPDPVSEPELEDPQPAKTSAMTTTTVASTTSLLVEGPRPHTPGYRPLPIDLKVGTVAWLPDPVGTSGFQ